MSYSKTVNKTRPTKDSRKNLINTGPVQVPASSTTSKPKAQQEIIIPDEFIPPALTIHKFAIKDNMKFVNLGVRPQRLTLLKTLKFVEDVYGKLCRLKPK